MEAKMKLSMITLALCFALAPITAQATAQHHHPLHHLRQEQRYAIPKSATAFVPAVRVDDDSDGLSRNPDECNRGCIDNGF
jgi:hypothetical protein